MTQEIIYLVVNNGQIIAGFETIEQAEKLAKEESEFLGYDIDIVDIFYYHNNKN